MNPALLALEDQEKEALRQLTLAYDAGDSDAQVEAYEEWEMAKFQYLLMKYRYLVEGHELA